MNHIFFFILRCFSLFFAHDLILGEANVDELLKNQLLVYRKSKKRGQITEVNSMVEPNKLK
jgi:hypothetical protein